MHDPESQPERLVIRQSGEMLEGHRSGDRRIRLSRRPRTQKIPVRERVFRPKPWNPAPLFVYSFAILIVVGTVLLALPASSRTGEWTSLFDALFTAASAACLTGLVVLDTGTHWSGFGHAVILLLIQIGGIGFMTSSTMLLLLIGYQATIRQRLLVREAVGSGGLGSALGLARNVTVFALVAEATGAVVLSMQFLTEMDAPQAIWWGAFHAVSGFNNAGFDLVGGHRSLTPFYDDPAILLTVGSLMFIGAISYTVVEDVIRNRRFQRLTLDTKVTVTTSCVLVILGMGALLFTERNNTETLGDMAIGTRLLNALFQSVTRTGGFSSVDIGRMTEEGLLVLIALMFVGGAASSTGGGIKVQTFGLLFFAIVSSVRGRSDVEAFDRRVPQAQVMRALSIALLSVAAVLLIFFALSATEHPGFAPLLFEAFSAFGTVGLSTGITADLSTPGRIVIIVAMFVGRLGPLTMALALAYRERPSAYQLPEETIKLG